MPNEMNMTGATRREFLAAGAGGLAAAAAIGSRLAWADPPPEGGKRPPNIIFVLFDDLGLERVGSYNPKAAGLMPNYDRLGTQGMRFTDAHSASAVCTPTRYGVVTGRYPWRIGPAAPLGGTDPWRTRT